MNNELTLKQACELLERKIMESKLVNKRIYYRDFENGLEEIGKSLFGEEFNSSFPKIYLGFDNIAKYKMDWGIISGFIPWITVKNINIKVTEEYSFLKEVKIKDLEKELKVKKLNEEILRCNKNLICVENEYIKEKNRISNKIKTLESELSKLNNK